VIDRHWRIKSCSDSTRHVSKLDIEPKINGAIKGKSFIEFKIKNLRYAICRAFGWLFADNYIRPC